VSRFNGWVQMPRLPIDAVVNDELTGLEHYSLMVLTLLADASTGSDRTNAPLLCYYTGHVFGHDTAARILANLHAKQRIWYKAKPFSKKPQPYWVNDYTISRGPYKKRRINLAQLYDESILSQEMVWKLASRPEEQGEEQGEDNYETGNRKRETKPNPNSKEVCAPLSAQSATTARKQSAQRAQHVRPRCAPCAPQGVPAVANVRDTSVSPGPDPPPTPEQQRVAIQARRKRWETQRAAEANAGRDVAWLDSYIAKCDSELTTLEVR